MATFEVKETKEALIQAVSQMAEREKTVLTLYYYEGLTLAEIGDILGVTESRVCQIHTKAVLQLRAKLADRPEAAGRRARGLGVQGVRRPRLRNGCAPPLPADGADRPGRRLTAGPAASRRRPSDPEWSGPGPGHYHGRAPPTGGAFVRDLSRTRTASTVAPCSGCCGRDEQPSQGAVTWPSSR